MGGALADVGSMVAGRYLLREVLGTGGMGEVWRAWDEEVGEDVALKLLRSDRIPSLSRFRREVRLARRVTHRSVARTHDLGRDGDSWFLTMELVPGRSLRDVLAEGRIDVPLAAGLMAQVADGLVVAHAAGVVHRDLKPANIMVTPSGRAVLTDFGIARSVVDSDDLETRGTVGTPAYMAPEQLTGDPIDGRADLYALGLVLFEAVTGQRPFGPGTPGMAARLRRSVPDPARVLELPDAARQLIRSLLARYPDDRPASAAEVATALRGLADGEVTQVLLDPPDQLTSVAVLPLQWLGPEAEGWLAEALTEALGDALARTRGLVVRLRTDPDSWQVSGSVQRAGDRVRVGVRLVDTTATQVWSDRVEAVQEDVLALQDLLGARIAEELRVAIALHPRSPLPWGAVERYLRARVASRVAHNNQRSVAADLALLVEEFPDFTAAVAALALARARTLWQGHASDVDEAHDAVARAERQAPLQPETWMASALLATDEGRFRDAMLHLGRAVEVAPGAAQPMVLLGQLECEAGRVEQGLSRLNLAAHLDPALRVVWFEIGRQRALAGDLEGGRALLMRGDPLGAEVPLLMLQARISAWAGDLEGVAEAVGRLPSSALGVAWAQPWGALVTGQADPDAVALEAASWLSGLRLRHRCLIRQVLAEGYCVVQRPDLALEQLVEASKEALIDIGWMDRCPVLESLRDDPRFEEARRTVRVRAELAVRV